MPYSRRLRIAAMFSKGITAPPEIVGVFHADEGGVRMVFFVRMRARPRTHRAPLAHDGAAHQTAQRRLPPPRSAARGTFFADDAQRALWVWVSMAIRFPMVPLGMNRPASCPPSAASSCRRLTVRSSAKRRPDFRRCHGFAHGFGGLVMVRCEGRTWLPPVACQAHYTPW